MSFESPRRDDRECDRCEREIHQLEPAATLQFGGAFGFDKMMICFDCAQVLVEWWEVNQENDD